jgi:glycosyltransferase involved in cell wall biosynthesis
MILIDALYVNNGGGKILLDYLTSELFKKNTDNIYFLFDKRVKEGYKNLAFKNKIFLKPSLIQRHIFYLNNKNKFSKIFAFGNIPPTVKMKCEVITYFQNVILLENGYKNIKLELKKIVFKLFRNYTNYWFVQTDSVKNLLEKNKINKKKIRVYPFFKKIELNIDINKTQSCKFLYVSSGEEHKNHKNLFLAFQEFNKEIPTAELIVTISNNYKDLITLINNYKKSDININNINNISHQDLLKKYNEIDFVIYPSLKESFGLGLIEAAQFNLPIIASDLEYVYDVIDPVEVFNPHDIQSILISLRKYKTYYTKKSEIKVENKLNIIINEILNK